MDYKSNVSMLYKYVEEVIQEQGLQQGTILTQSFMYGVWLLEQEIMAGLEQGDLSKVMPSIKEDRKAISAFAELTLLEQKLS